jgi:ribose transport system permease protein
MTRVGSGNNILGILIAFVLLCAIMGVSAPNFFRWTFPERVPAGVHQLRVALGMSYVIISGGIDLSIGSNMAVVGC